MAERLGVGATFVSRVIGGHEPITGTILKELANNFANLNMDWVLHGRGTMLITEQSPPTAVVREPEYAYERVTPGVFSSAEATLAALDARLQTLELELERTRAAAVVLEVRVKGLEAQLKEKG